MSNCQFQYEIYLVYQSPLKMHLKMHKENTNYVSKSLKTSSSLNKQSSRTRRDSIQSKVEYLLFVYEGLM